MDQDDLRRRLAAIMGELATPATHDLDDGIEIYKSERVRPGLLKAKSLDAYNRGLRRLSEWRGDSDIATTNWRVEAAEWFAFEGRRVWLALQLLRGILLMAQRQGWRHGPHNLDDVLKRSAYTPREIAYTAGQVGAYLEAADRLDRRDTDSGKATTKQGAVRMRAREVNRLLAITGCREEEIAELTFNEVGPGCIRLRDSKTGARVVAICEEAERIIGRQRVSSTFVFPGMNPHKPLSCRTVQHAFHEIRIEAGIKEGTPHAFRHTFATLGDQCSVPSKAIQGVLGHGDAYMTRRYTHASRRDEQLAAAVVVNAIKNGGRSNGR